MICRGWSNVIFLLSQLLLDLHASCCAVSMYSILHSGLCFKQYAFCFCVHPCVIECVCIRCLHEANIRVATVRFPGGLVSIPSPIFLITSFSYATHNLGLVDVWSKTSKRRKSTEQHLDEKMDKYFCKSLRLRPLKVVPRTSPPPPCSTNYCFKQKGELSSEEIGETLTC